MLQPTALDLNSHQYAAVVQFMQALGSTLDLHDSFGRAMPILRDLVGADNLALALSRPGSLHDYEWLTTDLPDAFLENYVAIAPHDFVLKAVMQRPNQVLRDTEMIDRPTMERNLVFQHAKRTAGLEHVMAVMLVHEAQWTSGLSLYRKRKVEFSEREAALLQWLVPQITHAVRNSRELAEAQRESLLQESMEHTNVGVIWLDEALREVSRTATATRLLASYLEPDERPRVGVPGVMLTHLQAAVSMRDSGGLPEPFSRVKGLSRLEARFIFHPERRQWSVVLRAHGLSPELESKLTPRLVQIAKQVLSGMSNEEIAASDGRAVATIKQQVSDACRRLGVNGRKGLIRLAASLEA